jgi:hypothetical protein
LVGCVTNTSVVAALAGNIPRSIIAELIIAELERVPDDCDSHNTSHAVMNFLRFGHAAGYRGKPSVWSLFSEEQFVRAATICAVKSPREFFQSSDYLKKQLGRKFANAGRQALLRVPGNCNQKQKAFLDEQEVAFQVSVLGTHLLSVATAIRFIVELTEAEVESNFYALRFILDSEELVGAYRLTWQERHNDEGTARLPLLEQKLEELLEMRGWIVGTVYNGTKTRRADSPRPQLQVAHENRIYVLDNWQLTREYMPQPGDRVFINTTRIKKLTPKICSTAFICATR